MSATQIVARKGRRLEDWVHYDKSLLIRNCPDHSSCIDSTDNYLSL